MLGNLATVAVLEANLGVATARLSDALHVARQIDDRFTEYFLLSSRPTARRLRSAISGRA
jgi:hypothetical protein